jgi:hypothetical protein
MRSMTATISIAGLSPHWVETDVFPHPTYGKFTETIDGPAAASALLPDRAAAHAEGKESFARSTVANECLTVHNAGILHADLPQFRRLYPGCSSAVTRPNCGFGFEVLDRGERDFPRRNCRNVHPGIKLCPRKCHSCLPDHYASTSADIFSPVIRAASAVLAVSRGRQSADSDGQPAP